LIVVGRQAIDCDKDILGRLDKRVREGSTVIVFAQSPEVLARYLGFRASPYVSRRVFPVSNAHPVTARLDVTNLRDWTSVLTRSRRRMTARPSHSRGISMGRS
jgi:hypothetical protein